MLALILKLLELLHKEFGRYLKRRKTIHKELGSSFVSKHIETLKEIVFPKRPGQPQCHHYMKTGTYKFGSTCKYDHPQYLSTPRSNYILSPLGLPIRPVILVVDEICCRSP